LIDIEGGEVESGPGGEHQEEEEELVSPTVMENLTDCSPCAFGEGVGVPLGDDLLLATWMDGGLPKVGLTVWE